MSVAALLAVHAQREEIGALVAALTEDEKRDLTDGRRAVAASLLEVVEDSRTAHVGERHDRPSTPKSQRTPARLTPVQWLADVDRVTGNHDGRPRRFALRVWAARVCQSDDPDVLAVAVEQLGGWLTSARTITEAPRFLPIRGATCPACGYRDVIGDGDAGERVVEPALSADLRYGVVSCGVDGCGAWWPSDDLEHLAAMIERQTTVETLAVE